MIEATPTIVRRVRHYDQALAEHGHRAALYAEALRWADPLADAVVADFAALGHSTGMAMIARALPEGVDAVEHAPHSFVALVRHDINPENATFHVGLRSRISGVERRQNSQRRQNRSQCARVSVRTTR